MKKATFSQILDKHDNKEAGRQFVFSYDHLFQLKTEHLRAFKHLDIDHAGMKYILIKLVNGLHGPALHNRSNYLVAYVVATPSFT